MTTTAIEYFAFEEDFVEDNVRCIPMIVRYKLDACLVKLKLAEWSRMTVEERSLLAVLPCETAMEIEEYRNFLCDIIQLRTGQNATPLSPAAAYTPARLQHMPASLCETLDQQRYTVSSEQWHRLSVLQRFALVKLSTSTHEQKNFPHALREFNLLQ
jgi:hypothetical protein